MEWQQDTASISCCSNQDNRHGSKYSCAANKTLLCDRKWWLCLLLEKDSSVWCACLIACYNDHSLDL